MKQYIKYNVCIGDLVLFIYTVTYTFLISILFTVADWLVMTDEILKQKMEPG